MNVPETHVSIPQPTVVLYGSGVALACGLNGEISSDRFHGFFAADTRVLSTYRMLISGHSWTLLGRHREGAATATFTFQNPKLSDIHGEVREGTILLQLRRRVERALHDSLHLHNFSGQKRLIRLTFLIDGDFSDIFSVHSSNMIPHLEIKRIPHGNSIHFYYERKDFRRGLLLEIHSKKQPPHFVGSSVVFDLELTPCEDWECSFHAQPEIERRRLSFFGKLHNPEPDIVPSAGPVSLVTEPLLQSPFDRGRADLHSLAIPQKNAPPFVAAGVPWFLTLFGRDTLVTSLMMGIDGTWAAEGALKALADRQAIIRDDWRDAEPGKFPHEIRVGELAHFGNIPHSAYYATHDAQALYCLALWNAWRWTGRRICSTPTSVRQRERCSGVMSWAIAMGMACSSIKPEVGRVTITKAGKTRGMPSWIRMALSLPFLWQR